MKKCSASCFIFLVSALVLSCTAQSDDSPGEHTSESAHTRSAKLINEDSIRKAELDRLLLNRFRCYVIRQSLVDSKKLPVQDTGCLCKTERQENIVSEKVGKTENIDITVQLEKALAGLDPNKLNILSNLADTSEFVAFWTDSFFKEQKELNEFRNRRDSSKQEVAGIHFKNFQDSLGKWLLADYPVLRDSGENRTARIVSNMLAENQKADPVIDPPVNLDPPQWFYWSLFVSALACVLSAGITIAVLNRKINRLKTQQQKEKPVETLSADLKKQMESTQAAVRTLEEHVVQLKKSLATLSDQKKSEPAASEINASVYNNETVSSGSTRPQQPLRVLFFSSPNSDGSFQNSSGRSEAVPGASIYRFELLNETTAHFTAVDSSDAAHLALGTPENALKPACEYLNIPPRVEQIVTLSPGVASLEGSTWRVNQKAKISFR